MKREQRILFACTLFVSGAGFGAMVSSRGPFTATEIVALIMFSGIGFVVARPLVGEKRFLSVPPKEWGPNLRQ